MYFEDFKKYKNDFLTYINIEKNLSLNTQKSYKGDFKLFSDFWTRIEQEDAEKIELRRALERYFVFLFHKKIDKSSVARKISCFRSFEQYLKIFDIRLNLKLKRPRIDKKLPTYLTVDEIFYLLDTVQDKDLPSIRPIRDKTIFELLYATGIRCSELCNIKIQDVNLEEKVIRITGKGRKERFALFGKKAKERIIEYLEKERPKPVSDKDFLLVSHVNEPLNQRTVQRVMKMFRSFLQGNKNITPHKIRHSFATHLLNQGTDLRVVQELLGHATLASTEKYTHITSAQLADMCDTIHPLNTMEKEEL
ncbi:MAG: tyrosine-type recombinase/integrase [Candidatus Babeliales bacterium]|jgi:site-specific recombinase XerD